MARPSFTHIMLLSGLLMTALLLWFAFSNCRSARPVAQCFLRGVALSLGQAIESIASRDPSLKLLSDFKSSDIAYFSVIAPDGTIRFHSNADLIGEQVEDTRYRPVFTTQIVTEERVTLGTGEVVFEFQQQLHLGNPLVLRLALHTWQADQVVQRARTGGGLIVALLAASWGFGLWTLRLQRRDQLHRAELIRHEQLAQLGQLGAVLAHEVRTPLAGIKGYAQLLEERLSDERQHRYAHCIVAESQRLEALVNDLLTCARHDPLPEGITTIAEAVHGAWEQLAAGASTKGINFEVIGTVTRPVACPPDRLRQVLLNLFNNALQSMPEGGRLQVVLSCDDAMANIVIADSGPGFDEASLQRIFDPFFTTRASGSGLGLTVCRKFVEGYGGSIAAANTNFGGAEIRLQLPLVKEQLHG